MSETIKAQIDLLEAFPAQLRERLQGLSERELRYKPDGAEWSILEIVGHMLDVGALWPGRTRQMLASDNPTLAAADPNWVTQRDYQNKQLQFLLISLAEQRAEYVEFLRVLRPSQLERSGQHPTYGAITVADGIGALARHDQVHSEQIAGNLAHLRASK